jgi:hypothetical protein
LYVENSGGFGNGRVVYYENQNPKPAAVFVPEKAVNNKNDS